MMTTTEQLELGFQRHPVTPAFPTAGQRRHSRTTRAKWWFAQMRAAVANAVDWSTPPPGQPGQAWLLNPPPRLKI